MKISLRVSILTSMLALVLATSVGIVSIAYSTSRGSIDDVLGKLIDKVSGSAIHESTDFFAPVEKVLRTGAIHLESMGAAPRVEAGTDDVGAGEIRDRVSHMLAHLDGAALERAGLSGEEMRGVLTERLTRLRAPVDFARRVIRLYPEIRSIEGGSPDKTFTGAFRMLDGSISTKFVLPLETRRGRFVLSVWDHQNDDYYVKDVRKPISGGAADFKNKLQQADAADVYDPTTRAWYVGAQKLLGAGGADNPDPPVYWAPPRVFYSDEAPGVSVSMPIADSAGRLAFVLSINLGIMGISTQELASLKIGHNGRVFIIGEGGELIAFSPASNPADREAVFDELKGLVQEVKNGAATANDFKLTPVSQASTPLFRDAFMKSDLPARLASQGRIDLTGQQTLSFDSGGTRYLEVFRPYPKDFHWKWTLGIVVPEDDFMGSVKRNTFIMLSVSALALLLGVFFAFLLSSRITASLKLLVDEANRIRLLQLDSNNPIHTSLRELHLMGESFANMKSGLRSFAKYVPSDLVRFLIRSGTEAVLGGEQRRLTIFFSDIVGFTPISESLSPSALVDALGDYLSETSQIIDESQGTIDKYIGDAIMAFWGAPREVEDHAFLACKAALECQKRQAELRATRWKDKGLPLFESRIGINTGDVVVGNMGSRKRLNYTVIGDSVNLASRVEGLNKLYGTVILITESTFAIVGHRVLTRRLDVVAVKGKSQPVALYELIGLVEERDEKAHAWIADYEQGLASYTARDFNTALGLFRKVAAARDDLAAQMFVERCEELLANPPGASWSAVSKLEHK